MAEWSVTYIPLRLLAYINYELNHNLQMSYFIRITHGSLSLNRSIHLYASVTTRVYSTSSTSLLGLTLSPQYHIYLTLTGTFGVFPLFPLLLTPLGDTSMLRALWKPYNGTPRGYR